MIPGGRRRADGTIRALGYSKSDGGGFRPSCLTVVQTSRRKGGRKEYKPAARVRSISHVYFNPTDIDLETRTSTQNLSCMRKFTTTMEMNALSLAPKLIYTSCRVAFRKQRSSPAVMSGGRAGGALRSIAYTILHTYRLQAAKRRMDRTQQTPGQLCMCSSECVYLYSSEGRREKKERTPAWDYYVLFLSDTIPTAAAAAAAGTAGCV